MTHCAPIAMETATAGGIRAYTILDRVTGQEIEIRPALSPQEALDPWMNETDRVVKTPIATRTLYMIATESGEYSDICAVQAEGRP